MFKTVLASRGAGPIFTALHAMQTRSSDVCLSVRPSVCQTRAL